MVLSFFALIILVVGAGIATLIGLMIVLSLGLDLVHLLGTAILLLFGLAVGAGVLLFERQPPHSRVVAEAQMIERVDIPRDAESVPPAPGLRQFPLVSSSGTPLKTEDPLPVQIKFAHGSHADGPDDTPTAIREVVRNSAGVVVSGGSVSLLPEWVRESSEAEDGESNFVLKSERFATLEEAREDLRRQMHRHLQEQMRGILPRSFSWSITPKDLEQSGVIRKECEVIWPLEIGEFQESVHEVYWQIDFGGKSRKQLMLACRPLVVKARLIQLGGVISVTSLILGVAALLTRRRKAV